MCYHDTYEAVDRCRVWLKRLTWCVIWCLLVGGLFLATPGCTKDLSLREYDPETGTLISEGKYRNTSFDTEMDGFELRKGGTVIKIDKYNASSKEAYQAISKGFDALKAVAEAGK
jgi:hypothetical protein